MLSHRLLFKPVFMVQTTKNWTCHHSQVLWNAVPLFVQWHKHQWRWLWDTWTQGYMRASCIVISHPFYEDTSQVMFCQRDHEIQAFAPQRA
jgi:hypothetical protein